MPVSHELSFTGRRSPVLGTRGMAATSQPLAVAAGLQILEQGGNAADAAVAAAAALNVTEPTSTGIGGDCFALYYDAATRQVSALNGSGRAPAALTLERLEQEGFERELPPFHPYTITVPGACAGWCDLVQMYGRLPLGTVLAPAIHLAEQGFPVAPITAYFWERGVERQLSQAPGGQELTIDGRAPRPGEIFRNPGLGRTFKKVVEGGKAAFYEGDIAVDLAATVQQAGGCLSLDDLAGHTSTWEQPISTTYRGVRVWECPPNGQGLAALLALNLLEGFEIQGSEPLSVGRLHLLIEAMRLAFADARWYVADPASNPAPLVELLSKEYAAERRRLINPRRATLDQVRGAPVAASDTVYLSVVDGDGNACSFINSNYMGFGTGICPQGWGFTLQNRGHNFSLDPEHPNALDARQATLPYHHPGHGDPGGRLALRQLWGDGRLHAAAGPPAGGGRPDRRRTGPAVRPGPAALLPAGRRSCRGSSPGGGDPWGCGGSFKIDGAPGGSGQRARAGALRQGADHLPRPGGGSLVGRQRPARRRLRDELDSPEKTPVI